MKSLFKFKFYFPLLLLLIALIILLNYYNYPSEWNEIELGQKRNLIHQNIGIPTYGDLWDMKGDIWVDDHFFSWHRLDVFYNSDTVVYGYHISIYYGNKTDFYRCSMKSGFSTSR